MDIKDFVGLGGIPLVQAIVAAIKTMFPQIPARYYPGLSIFWGVVISVGLSYLLSTDYRTAVFVGVVTGLAASGLFQYGKQQERII